ncbi:hypothetical protein B7494_g8019 [Chlorociboria aeruginascens]|nr:hypothetical protein B7494_g8019 [Chlorociboria aeruginascens]
MQFTFFALLALAASIVSALPEVLSKKQAIDTSVHQGTATINPVGTTPAQGSCPAKFSDGTIGTAISDSAFMHDEGNSSPYCGQLLQVTFTGLTTDQTVSTAKVGTTVKNVMVVDTCVGCDEGHLDLTWGAWTELTGLNSTVVAASWNFCGSKESCD